MSEAAMSIADDHVVAIEFTASDEAGNLLERTAEGAPLQYLHGAGNLVPGLEAALAGRQAGDRFEVLLTPAEAFGERSADLEGWMPREAFASVEPLEIGMQLAVEDQEGSVMPIWIRQLQAKRVLVDGNHPFSGRTLRYAVHVLAVRAATGAELDHGHPHAGDCGESAH